MMKPTTTIELDAHLAAAEYLIKHFHDEGLVVLDARTDEPVATITDTTIADAMADGRDLEDTRVGEIVTERPVAVDADVRAEDAARLMQSHGIERLPVVHGRQVVGIVELADLRGTSRGSGPYANAEATS